MPAPLGESVNGLSITARASHRRLGANTIVAVVVTMLLTPFVRALVKIEGPAPRVRSSHTVCLRPPMHRLTLR